MCFLKEKFFDDDKRSIFMIYFLCQIEILLLNMLKLKKNPVFFCLNCQIPGNPVPNKFMSYQFIYCQKRFLITTKL